MSLCNFAYSLDVVYARRTTRSVALTTSTRIRSRSLLLCPALCVVKTLFSMFCFAIWDKVRNIRTSWRLELRRLLSAAPHPHSRLRTAVVSIVDDLQNACMPLGTCINRWNGTSGWRLRPCDRHVHRTSIDCNLQEASRYLLQHLAEIRFTNT